MRLSAGKALSLSSLVLPPFLPCDPSRGPTGPSAHPKTCAPSSVTGAQAAAPSDGRTLLQVIRRGHRTPSLAGNTVQGPSGLSRLAGARGN